MYSSEHNGFAHFAAIAFGGGNVVKLFATEEEGLDKRSGFVAAWADRGRDTDVDVLRSAVKLFLHGLDGRDSDAASGAAPARVRHADDVLDGIVEYEGYAVGKGERD